MKYSFLIAISLFASANAYSSNDVHWGYTGKQGPDHWATLSPENSACSGKNQSPIDLSRFVDADLPPIEFNYSAGAYEILNNGHTVQINYKKGSSIKLDGKTFNLLQFHFHTPSENHIMGHEYPLEAHLVHASKDGELAVVAVMFEKGDTNPTLQKVWSKMPVHKGDHFKLSEVATVKNLLPKSTDYYRFNGSLTTPPCTEGVRWIVMQQPVNASPEQIKQFAHALHGPNNRPVQQMHARTVLK